jgi:hypothetical protein
MRFPALALLLLLTGCSGFPLPDWARSDTGSKTTSSGAADLAAPADVLSSCQEQARAMIERDQAIDQDIGNQDTNTDLKQGFGDLRNNLNEYNTKQRYERIVEDCMRARGYDSQNPNVKPVQVEQQGGTSAAPAATSGAAPEATPAPAPSPDTNPALPTYP